MKRVIFLLVSVLCAFFTFSVGKSFANDVVVDFSGSSGFGLSAEEFQINNISVTWSQVNPFTGEASLVTESYDVIWQWVMEDLALRPVRLAGGEGGVECETASLEVQVTNALTGEPVAGATVTVGDISAVTDSSGLAQLSGLPGQTVQIMVSAPGYLSQSTSEELHCDDPSSLGISLLPAADEGVARGDIRIVLTWGEEPRDLDSHLTGPLADFPNAEDMEHRFHVYYAARNNCDASPCDPSIPAWLDVDDTTSFGPETITITKVGDHFVPGRYRYSVHHFAGALNIPQSSATVKIFVGDRLLKTYTPPNPVPGMEVGDDWIWTVCDIMVSEDGQISILDVNEYTGPTFSDDMVYFNSFKTFLGVPVGPENPALFRNLPPK